MGLSAEELQTLFPSLPVRGAWIEMLQVSAGTHDRERRSPCGERGLKFSVAEAEVGYLGRSPCGERGLKCDGIGSQVFAQTVAPRAGSVD